jgi:hypothetical protein
MLAWCGSLALLGTLLGSTGSLDRSGPRFLLAGLAGLALGFAVMGRQQYLPAIPAIFLLALGPGRRIGLGEAFVYTAAACVLPAVVFSIWGGPVPPHTARVGEGVSITHLGLSFAYSGVAYSIYDVSWIRRRWLLFLVLLVVCGAANLALGVADFTPMRQTALRVFSEQGLMVFGRIATGLLLGFGVCFAAWFARQAVSPDAVRRYCAAACLFMLLTPAKITHMFAGRYALVALPLLILISCEESRDTPWKAARMALATALGLASLYSTMTG